MWKKPIKLSLLLLKFLLSARRIPDMEGVADLRVCKHPVSLDAEQSGPERAGE